MSADKFCWSLDEEEFHGDCASREEAIDEAEAAAIEDDTSERGGKATVWTGRVVPAMFHLRKRESWIGEWIVELLDEVLIDKVYSEEPIVTLDDEAQLELGLLVLDFVERRASFQRYGVADVEAHEVYVTKEGEA